MNKVRPRPARPLCSLCGLPLVKSSTDFYVCSDRSMGHRGLIRRHEIIKARVKYRVGDVFFRTHKEAMIAKTASGLAVVKVESFKV